MWRNKSQNWKHLLIDIKMRANNSNNNNNNNDKTIKPSFVAP
jgi:hypothetical protein